MYDEKLDEKTNEEALVEAFDQYEPETNESEDDFEEHYDKVFDDESDINQVSKWNKKCKRKRLKEGKLNRKLSQNNIDEQELDELMTK